MPRPFKQRLPFAPLGEVLPPTMEPRRVGRTHIDQEICTARKVADLLGCDRRTAHRWVHAGVPVDDADELAVMLGMHPMEIWGDDWLLLKSVTGVVHSEFMECA